MTMVIFIPFICWRNMWYIWHNFQRRKSLMTLWKIFAVDTQFKQLRKRSGMMDPLKLTSSQQLWLPSSVGRALHRYRRGHGFESRWSLNFFQASLSQLLKSPLFLLPFAAFDLGVKETKAWVSFVQAWWYCCYDRFPLISLVYDLNLLLYRPVWL